MSRAPQLSGGCPGPHEYGRSFFLASVERPAEDVASPEIEPALADLERALCRDRSHAVVAAPPGPMSTLLLRALRKRLPGSLRVIQVAAPTVREDEICARILGELRQQPGHDAEARLLGFVQELARRDSALVLLIDDADTMQAQTLGCLGRLARASRSGLRLVLVVTIEPRSEGNAIAGLVVALGVGAQKVVLPTRRERAQSEARARAPLEHSELDRGSTALATAPAPGPAAPAWGSGKAWQRSRSPAGVSRAAARRGSPSRARRWPLGASVAGGIALALLGVQLLSASPGPREAVLEPERIAEPSEADRSQVAAASQSAPSRPEAAPGGSEDAARSAGSGRSEARTHPAGKIRAASATAVRPIPVSLNARPWARIEVDGREVGVTPLANIPMAPGLHRFRAHLADGRVVERTLQVDAYRNHIRFP